MPRKKTYPQRVNLVICLIITLFLISHESYFSIS